LLGCNSHNHIANSIISDELEKVLKLTKNGKITGEDNFNSGLYKYVPEEFKIRLVIFLNYIYTHKKYCKWMQKCRYSPKIYERWYNGSEKLERN